MELFKSLFHVTIYSNDIDKTIEFYEKLGFRIIGVKPNAIRLKDGTLLNEYSMIKELKR